MNNLTNFQAVDQEGNMLLTVFATDFDDASFKIRCGFQHDPQNRKPLKDEWEKSGGHILNCDTSEVLTDCEIDTRKKRHHYTY
jgi:hypothetical protein